MKHSIRRRITLIFSIVLIVAFVICWLVNNFFLENYYVQDKKKALINVYTQLDVASENQKLNDEEFVQNLGEVCETKAVSLLVMESDGDIELYTMKDYRMMQERLYEYLFQTMIVPVKDKILEENDTYTIRINKDVHMNLDYLEIIGTLKNGEIFMIRTALKPIRDSVMLANRFLAYVGVISVLIGTLVIQLITKRITEPILELAKLSERMSNLDFDVKFSGGNDDEIAVLGYHINQLSEKLEKTISELKTANNELQRDIEQIEKNDGMRKEFLSNVSHELKTPIALIQGYAEGLKECINDDPESRDFYCDVIIDESAKMNNMVKNLLNLNELEFGNEVVEMEHFDIVSMIHNFLQSAKILFEQKQIKVIFNDSEPIYVWANEFKMEEVMNNYISNALNHVEGEKVIKITLTKVGDLVRVGVFNTGRPIPDQDIEKIWDKFYKVDKARTREYGGSGVGLSIVKAIMESMHREYGVINYENGVEFWCNLDCKIET